MINQKLKKIKLLILDVDGVLTDGRIVISAQGEAHKFFNVKDGLGIKLLHRMGMRIAVITGKNSAIVNKRLSDLGIDDVYQNQPNKIEAFDDLKHRYKLNNDQIAYIGDDLPDLPLIKRSGVAITVNDGHYLMHDHVDYVTQIQGGHGAVREAADLFFRAHGLIDKLLDDFIEVGEARKYDS
jgi:3-deoxy-D-manno-octulosonate 8-phosphate phosphatase (KDO 8-P phosphatase)